VTEAFLIDHDVLGQTPKIGLGTICELADEASEQVNPHGRSVLDLEAEAIEKLRKAMVGAGTLGDAARTWNNRRPDNNRGPGTM